MGVSGNPANRAAARAQGLRSADSLLSQLLVIDDLGDKPSDAIAVAIGTGLGSLVEQGGAPLERSSVTIGTDHPDHPGKVVVEVSTKRRRSGAFTPVLGDPLTLSRPVPLPSVTLKPSLIDESESSS